MTTHSTFTMAERKAHTRLILPVRGGGGGRFSAPEGSKTAQSRDFSSIRLSVDHYRTDSVAVTPCTSASFEDEIPLYEGVYFF